MDHLLIIRILAIACGFGLIVFVHEMGHFILARLAGMKVHEFSIGFGRPLLFWFRRGDTQFSIRLWPFFAYVRIAGMDPDEDDSHGFYSKPRYAQAAVLAAGPVMNFALAVAVFVVMGSVIGLPAALTTVAEVLPGTPAAAAGFLPGDRILGFEDRTGLEVHEIQRVLQRSAGKPVTLVIERDGATRTITVTPKAEPYLEVRGLRVVKRTIGIIGIGFSSHTRRVGVIRAVGMGFRGLYDVIRVQIAGLLAVATGAIPPEFVGPVGMVSAMYSEAKAGWAGFLGLLAAIAALFGFFNLLPIPPLDGSRLFILALESVRGKPFDKRKEFVFHLVGLVLLLGLAIIVMYKDITRIASGTGP